MKQAFALLSGLIFGLGLIVSGMAKGPVMDRLKRSHFLEALTGEVFLSQHKAICMLDETGPYPNSQLASSSA